MWSVECRSEKDGEEVTLVNQMLLKTSGSDVE
jgi:hypothetical protein